MLITRMPGAPRAVRLGEHAETVYEMMLSATPSIKWRAAFFRPPPQLVDARFTPELGRVGITGAALYFRTTPAHRHAWLDRIGDWIGYANSMVHQAVMDGSVSPS